MLSEPLRRLYFYFFYRHINIYLNVFGLIASLYMTTVSI